MILRKTHTSKLCKVRVGITIGDPSGIGPAITLKAISQLQGLAYFYVIGDKWVLNKFSSLSSGLSSTEFIYLNNITHKKFEFGKIKAEYGRASIEYLEQALYMIKQGIIDCLVTAPISKESITKAGFPYSGHTEFLSKRSHTKNPVMMLLNDQIKFSLVTQHTPLKDVSFQLSRDKVERTISLTFNSLKKLFSISNPRIVVCGLNPHASDNGIIGKEEANILKPVINALKNKIKNLYGPLSADVAILKAKQKEYDCVIAMYHDQALIPLKLTGYWTGVNITLGLPFIRTSPLHGTAFDIAKMPKLADQRSMIKAVKLAIQCTLNLKKG
jgi:4-hydroxythreonine-4-phosphate dehydrogenase